MPRHSEDEFDEMIRRNLRSRREQKEKILRMPSHPKPPRFRVGSICRMVSGGPAMTVAAEAEKKGVWLCQWFAHGCIHGGVFPEATLEECEADGYYGDPVE